MKLTKDEIKYIDNYLLKNEVRFWDVRLELLDHIVSYVENKIDNEGISFNEALLEVHRGFGNQIMGFSVHEKKFFEKVLYESNVGFKKFIRNKQKEIGKQNRRQFWIIFRQILLSYQFLVEYMFYMFIIYFCYQYHAKTAFILTLLALALPEFFKIKYVFRKGIRHSLQSNMMGLLTTSFLCFQSGSLSFYKEEFTINGIVNYSYITIAYVMFYPFARASFKHYKLVLKTTIERYNLLIS